MGRRGSPRRLSFPICSGGPDYFGYFPAYSYNESHPWVLPISFKGEIYAGLMKIYYVLGPVGSGIWLEVTFFHQNMTCV
ncbi:hypothetical protein EQP49_03360 [Yersinia sp. 2105 StPb PI]|nr:hypothetical protein EQP49_03360 [Yersinia sp. 2105 StPb PI]